MRSKAPLALMEQLVMVLVFALAAALCVQVFVLSGQTSRWNESRDRALVEAQNAAEILKGLSGDYEAACAACGGQWNGTMWGISLKRIEENFGPTLSRYCRHMAAHEIVSVTEEWIKERCGLTPSDTVPLVFRNKRQHLQDNITQESAHQVLSASGVQQRHIQHAYICLFFFGDNSPLFLNFIVISA